MEPLQSRVWDIKISFRRPQFDLEKSDRELQPKKIKVSKPKIFMKDPSHLYLIQFDSDIQYYTYEKTKNYEDVSSFIYEHLSTLCVILFNR